jgi:hypothetical protein
MDVAYGSICSLTGMFALSNSMSHVSSAFFAQARLRPGSGLLTLLIHLIRNRQLLTMDLKRASSPG